MQVHTGTIVSSQTWDDARALWTIQTEPPVPDLPPFDHVYFATGSHADVKEIDFLRTMNEKHPIETYGGLPALTDDLRWSSDVPLFITGKLATLQIGPGAANLEGARLSAERIAWAIDDSLDDGTQGVAIGGPRHRYSAGIGSRYDQLVEES